MRCVICPGIHDLQLTEHFLEGLGTQLDRPLPCQRSPLVFPAHRYPAYSTPHIVKFVHEQLSAETEDLRQLPLVLIGFSAGVVGAIGLAWSWQAMGGQIAALIALDGWGVPLAGDFPIHRISHDHFTHWSSALLGAGEDRFYADPAVEHLELWRSPQTTQGWWVSSHSQQRRQTTVACFLAALLQRYGVYPTIPSSLKSPWHG